MCSCDLDEPSVFEETRRKARKDYKCNSCRGKIAAGEEYIATFGIWDSDARRFKRCLDCDAFMAWVNDQDDCVCLSVGDILNDACEHFSDRGEQVLTEECYARAKAIRNKRREPVAA